MEIFDRIGMHFKNEITARNLRTARRTRCFRVFGIRDPYPAVVYLLRMHSRRYTCSTDLSLRREIKTKGIKSSVIDGLKRERGRKRKRETRGPCVESIEILSNEGVFALCARNINKGGGERKEGTRRERSRGKKSEYKYIIISVYNRVASRTLLVRLRGKCRRSLKLGNEGPSSLYNEIYNPLRSNKMLRGTRG